MSAISPSAPAFILLFFLLLFFPEQAIQGASDGLLLWFHTVLPTLAPAMICTRMLLLTGGDRLLIKPLRPLFCRFFALSDTGAFILLSGMICGYPLGPALCAQALEKNRITRKEAAYLLAFCSFPSPMFLAGYIPGQFPGPLPVGLLLLGIYLPALLLSWIAGHRFSPTALSNSAVPENSALPQKSKNLDSVLYKPRVLAPHTSYRPPLWDSGNDNRHPADLQHTPACRLPSCLRGLCRIWRNLRNFSDPECHCGFGLHRGQKKCRI